ncbi:hypothetical protein EDB84DRAFT_1406943, partial [Lactarius hengduanensis]
MLLPTPHVDQPKRRLTADSFNAIVEVLRLPYFPQESWLLDHGKNFQLQLRDVNAAGSRLDMFIGSQNAAGSGRTISKTPCKVEMGRARVTIEKLSDEVLLNIFRHYLGASPRFWPSLVHICRKWRRIVFASQRALHLWLFSTYGTPVLKTL